MNRIYLLSICAILIAMTLLSGNIETARAETYCRVDAPRGLRLRESPDLNAAVLVTIPNGAKVMSLEEQDREITIDGKKGKWTRISYGEQWLGWVFGGFLVEIEEELTLNDIIGGSFSFSIEEVEGADSTGFEILPDGQFKGDCLLHGSGDMKFEGTYRAVVKKGVIQLIIKGTGKGHHVAETETHWTKNFSNGQVIITRKKGVYRGTFRMPGCLDIVDKKLDATVGK
ncbi:MAG: SH3 domain-containing protein [Spirochaetes bacterium]|nr:SH3 domain-containing protein [Spirochaetota bacterium]